MKIVCLTPEEWFDLSRAAHLVVFRRDKPASWDRIHFVLVAEDESGMLGYITCRESDPDTVYWQFGGSFPETKGTVKTWAIFKLAVQWLKEAEYKRIHFYVENSNLPMLKLAMKADFRIIGTKALNGAVLVEHMHELGGS